MGQMQIVIGPDGTTTATTVDLLEDLWYDFLSFRRQADVAVRRKDLLKTKQHQRAALFTLKPYLTGVANRWCANVLKTGLDQDQIAHFLLEKSLAEKCDFLAKQVGETVPTDSLAMVCSLAAEFSNLTPDREPALFDALSSSELQAAEDKILSWYDVLATKLGFAKHEDTRKQGLAFAAALGDVIEESNRAFAELRKNPDAWKQELQERQEWE